MKPLSVSLLILSIAAFCGPYYAEAQMPAPGADTFRQEGIASWYGPEFDGRPTASGEIFNSSLLTAAHPTLPFGTMLTVTNQHNNKRVTVKVNDRGPFVSARIVDVSRAAAEQLDMLVTGTAPVLIESVNKVVMPVPAGNVPAALPDPYWSLPPEPPVQAQAPAPVYAAPAQAVPPAPVYAAPAPAAPPASVYAAPVQTASPVYAAPPPVYQAAPQAGGYRAALVPAITPLPDKVYRLQIGSYKVARNAVDSFDRLKGAGLNPAYERNGEHFRVVLAGIRGTEVQSVTEKLGSAGFREALIREER